MGQAPGAGRLHLLHRRLPRDHAALRRDGASGPHVRDGGQLPGGGARPGPLHDLRTVRCAGAHGAGVGLQHRHAAGRSGADDAVQGQGGRDGVRAGGTAELSGAPGGRHLALSSDGGAGRGGPAPASRADARDRTPVEPPVRGVLPGAAGTRGRGRPDPRAGWRGEDEQVARQHGRDAGLAGADRTARAHCGDGPAARPAQRPGTPGGVQRLRAAPVLHLRRAARRDRPGLPLRGARVRGVQAGAGGGDRAGVRAHAGAGR